MAKGYYETDRAVGEYLAFHYGSRDWNFPGGVNLRATLDFPVRCVTRCIKINRLAGQTRALDLGCAVGRSSFELARHCKEVIGIDFSKKFIATARQLQRMGTIDFDSVVEGELTHRQRAVVPAAIDRTRVHFETGDAMALHPGLGAFDVVMMANLIDRLGDPRRCLAQLPGFMKSGGQLIITSPYTWLPEYTPRKNWLGGFIRQGRAVRTLDTLKAILAADFRLAERHELPFLIREHARKFQLSCAEASVWIRK